MLTVLEAINLSSDFLQKKEIESPRINAEHLLAHTLNCKRLELYLAFDRPLKENEINKYRELIRRRSKAEPLQYILGSVEFFGMDFKVAPGVLIPRPETEVLVENIIEIFDKKQEIKILDIGTGSGIIAISLAKHFSNSVVTAIDISKEALEIAKYNSELNQTGDKISFYETDILSDNINLTNDYDLVVSNPPYVSLEEFSELRPELSIYEPRFSLTDEDDGLKFYKEISKKSKNLLKQNGYLYFELGFGKSEKVKGIMENNNFSEIKISQDYSNIDRVIYGINK
ncbi:MAG TPA: peptide chain release factor N(5)-glutamine methyltransferase [Ignavibacteriaceae bacterium]|nr:peptide chain release factor N(5)-glutamine methyltransferase [Ignavibacteriaceae bacterium]